MRKELICDYIDCQDSNHTPHNTDCLKPDKLIQEDKEEIVILHLR
jgi:hypothetical protein